MEQAAWLHHLIKTITIKLLASFAGVLSAVNCADWQQTGSSSLGQIQVNGQVEIDRCATKWLNIIPYVIWARRVAFINIFKHLIHVSLSLRDQFMREARVPVLHSAACRRTRNRDSMRLLNK